ncbi:Uncharacterised protein g11169 [Pycnogonum litorale]
MNYKIRALLSGVTYEYARKKLKQSEETSDLASDAEVKRKRTRKRISFSSSSSDEDVSLPKAPKVREIRDTCVPSASGMTNASASICEPESNASRSSTTVNDDLLRHILKTVVTIKQRQDWLISEIQSINGAKHSENSPENLPISSIAEFDDFDRELSSSSEKQESLVKFLSCFGCPVLQNTVYKILEELFSHACALRISWTGQNGKKKISDTSILKTIISK